MPREETGGWEASTRVVVWGAATALAALGCLTAGAHLWAWWSGAPAPAWNPLDLAVGLAVGTVPATTAMWAWVAAVAVLAALAAAAPALVRARGYRQARRGDAAARLAGSRRDSAPLGRRAVAAKARRLGVDGAVGLPVGRRVDGGDPVLSSFEDVATVIAGPRTGKTTSWVVPRILAAPGVVVATSNKRDVLDVTRADRADAGPVWVFDPQGIADEPQRFWWDPLGQVTDAVSADALAQVLADATREPGSTGSAFFDNAARELVASLLLAAARARRPVTVVHRWLTDQGDDEAVQILRDAGDTVSAETLQGLLNLVPETRSGVVGGAAQLVGFMRNTRAMLWVTPAPGVPELRPEELVAAGGGTLYCLSQEGQGSVSAIVTALTVAVTRAALDHAKTRPSGRLPVPMLIELDEAANICKWSELPAQYSHFGSRGICVDTVLQSWSQGTRVWGDAGMSALWSASNVKVYAGGVTEARFLSDLSTLIGEHWVDSVQVTSSATGSSTSRGRAAQARQIATAADLMALPAGRAWVLASGCRPVLARLVPYWQNKGK